MKKSLLACFSLLCAAVLVWPALSSAAYKTEYRLSVVPGPTSGWALTAEHFARLVKERSQGRINIKVYAAAQLMAGKQTSEFLLLRNGAIDFALGSTINWSPQVKELNLTAMPFFLAVRPDRYKAISDTLTGKGKELGLDEDFIRLLFETIHAESIRCQINKKNVFVKPDEQRELVHSVVARKGGI